MRLIKPSYEILNKSHLQDMPKLIERVARTCYQSEGLITDESYKKMIQKLIDRGHEAMIEFGDLIVRFTVDRGVSHELVRHRLASFAQESTRYCNYTSEKFDGHITFIIPPWFKNITEGIYFENTIIESGKYSMEETTWLLAMLDSERAYNTLIEMGEQPQQARAVLPNSLKTVINMKQDFRSWRNFFKLRVAPTAHPQMREETRPLLDEVKTLVPVVFDDITYEE